MYYNIKKGLFLGLILCLSGQAFAMKPLYEKADYNDLSFNLALLDLESNKDWKVLPRQELLDAIFVSPQEASYTCGQSCCTQLAKFLKIEKKPSLKEVVETCPLSIELEIERLGPFQMLISSFIQPSQREEGFIRVGATPHMLARYLNNSEHYGSLQAKAISTDNFNSYVFLPLVGDSLDRNLPTIMVQSKGPLKLHYLLIVGMNAKKQELLVLSSDQKLYTMPFEDLQKEMNATESVNLLRTFSGFRDGIAGLCEQLATSNDLSNWNTFSYITFTQE